MHFHAQWRRENPTTRAKNYTILETTGRGHFVGAALFMQAIRGRGLGFLEGDEMIYIDGESQPSIIGTGTEDYFSSGWYFDRGPYGAPYHGCPIKDEKLGRISAYRWHVEDAMPFTKSIKVTIEHGDGSQWDADYSSVAFWYQREPHAPFPRLPDDPKSLLPSEPQPTIKISGAIEAESLIAGAKSTSGAPIVQEMDPWAWTGAMRSKFYWKPEGKGATLTLNLPAPSAGTYELIGYFTKAPDYATVRARIGGQFLEPVLNLYSERVEPTGPVSFGNVRLQAGDNPLTFEVVASRRSRSDTSWGSMRSS
jgi:hypothetical protein